MCLYRVIKKEPEENKAAHAVKNILIALAVIVAVCAVIRFICKKFNINCPVFGKKKCCCCDDYEGDDSEDCDCCDECCDCTDSEDCCCEDDECDAPDECCCADEAPAADEVKPEDAE